MAHLRHRSGFELEVADGDAAALVRGYSRLDAHVCQMAHSGIMTISARPPTLNIGHDVKSRELFSLLGIDERCVDQIDAHEGLLFARASALRADTSGFAGTVARCRQMLRRNLATFQEEALVRGEARRWATSAT